MDSVRKWKTISQSKVTRKTAPKVNGDTILGLENISIL